MLNRWVASAFAEILTLIHLVVIVSFCGIVLLYFSQNSGQFRNAVAARGVTSDAVFLAAVIGSFVIYVLVVGTLATLIAINQNLERLNKVITKQPNALTSQSPPQTYRGYTYVVMENGEADLKLSHGWRRYPSVDELKLYVEAITK